MKHPRGFISFSILARIILLASLLATGLSGAPTLPVQAGTITDIIGPAGSGQFGHNVVSLPNGNLVVTDPSFSNGSGTNVGAAYLYDGLTLSLISTLTGSHSNDQVGTGIQVLNNGNYLITSTNWANGSQTVAGAVTFCSQTSGCQGVVSSANSLVGNHVNDQIGNGFYQLDNGNFLERSPGWLNATGAVTWCSQATGCKGEISVANSLIGSQPGDQIGLTYTSNMTDVSIIQLKNDNYVVNSDHWANGSSSKAGAVTWCSGISPCTGNVTAANSLVGSQPNDNIGGTITPLDNGNYIVQSYTWANGSATDAGAVTWCNGNSGCQGAVSPANSLWSAAIPTIM